MARRDEDYGRPAAGRLVDAHRDRQPLAAAALGAALAEDVERALERPRLRRLVELGDALVHLAEERFVAHAWRT